MADHPKIRIMTDSGCDIPLATAREYGLSVIPFPITCDGKTYIQGENFETAQEFYGIMAAAREYPTHGQITIFRFIEEFSRVYSEGCSDLILIPINAKASATYENALKARELFYEERPEARQSMHIHVVNTLCYSVTYGYPALSACRMVDEGKSVEEILQYLKDWFSRMEIYVAAYSLEYARRSGRIGRASAVLGEAMGIKPIISIIDGEAKTYRKVRGNGAIGQSLYEIAQERMTKGSPYLMLHGTYPDVDRVLRRQMETAMGYSPCGVYEVGPVVALNIGPKMLGIGFLGKPRGKIEG